MTTDPPTPKGPPHQREDEPCAPPPLTRRLALAGVHPPRYVGRPGQGPPRRFSALSWFGAVPGFLGQFTGEVPAEFWAVAALDVGSHLPAVATVSCVCGEEPEVRQMRTAVCSGQNCRRAFILIGDRIKVARFEEDAPPQQ